MLRYCLLVVLTLCVAACGRWDGHRAPIEHPTKHSNCETEKTGHEAIVDTFLAAIATLEKLGFPVHSINTETNTIYTEYALPKKVVVQWKIEVTGPGHAWFTAEDGGVLYDYRAMKIVDRHTRDMALILPELYCLSREELIEEVADSGVEFSDLSSLKDRHP